MGYLQTQVVTKTNETKWVTRLFVLHEDSLACFYESAPHLHDKGQNVLTKIVIPIKRGQGAAATNTASTSLPEGATSA